MAKRAAHYSMCRMPDGSHERCAYDKAGKVIARTRYREGDSKRTALTGRMRGGK